MIWSVSDITCYFLCRFNYSKEFLKWALHPPGYTKDWHVAIRVKATQKLVAFISAVPSLTQVKGQKVSMVDINFLCIHKKLRSKRLAPVLIKVSFTSLLISDIDSDLHLDRKWIVRQDADVWGCLLCQSHNTAWWYSVQALSNEVMRLRHASEVWSQASACLYGLWDPENLSVFQEITRRVNLRGIWQAAYTAGTVLPKPVATAQYWHRSLNPKKLIEVQFSRLAVYFLRHKILPIKHVTFLYKSFRCCTLSEPVCVPAMLRGFGPLWCSTHQWSYIPVSLWCHTYNAIAKCGRKKVCWKGAVMEARFLMKDHTASRISNT